MSSVVIARYPPNRCINCMFIMRSPLEDEYICTNAIRGQTLYYKEYDQCIFHLTYEEIYEYYKKRNEVITS